ncbi:nitrite/sulfite reductase [Clostridium magnum]|uniref:Sulfite reductase n=1 Tax=Clostridium magnum DSM 2767 TaxID=1121326 RepID=A0A162SI01_9CLOT|nr:nitrite/sulfite reductase [Clostridium magnum]KZL91289.1 sulfite reductase [Clostridium magnum DSM 2767]SHI36242.1 sulfite reductase (ferredoxin) [Clostridium magnum DSM 2767]
MMIEITEEILKSVEEFKNNLQQYNEGKIDNLKSFSSIMGIYKERLNDTYMVRPRIPGGVITIDQLKAISEIAKKYAEGKIRFTTRQDIQFHSVKIQYLSNVLDSLIKCGLTTKAAGGDGVRNVACSPLSGVARDEVFDVTPYMKEVANHMMKDPANLKLPRKYKIAFSNSTEDTVNATVTDIGFIAKIVDGKRGFEVYGAGGLGGGSRVGLKLEDFIEDTEALYYVQAMKQVFEREGDRTNRHKARLRFVVQRLGEEKFTEMFKNELEKVKVEQDLKIKIDLEEENIQNTMESNKPLWEKKYENIIYEQKQSGYYSLYIHPQNGNMHTNDLDKVLDFIASLNYKISIRLTMTQGFYVRDLKAKDVQALIDITSKFSSIFNIDNSVTCAGPKICNFGINNSQELLNNIIEAFKDKNDDVRSALPRILISGCPNSCAQPQKGLIGLIGKKRRTDSGLVPVYSVSFNGRVGAGGAKFGEVYGEIPAKKMTKFFLKLAEIKVNSGYIDFVEFIEKKEAEVRELVDQYSLIESFTENSDLYSDF